MTLMLPERLLARVASGERLLSDGAIGTELMRRGVLMEDLPRVALDKPDLLRSVHRDYLEAGADILTAHTFSWKPTREATREALRIAIEVAEGSSREVGVWFSVTEKIDISLFDDPDLFLKAMLLIETCSSMEAAILAATLLKIMLEKLSFALSAHVREDGTLLDHTSVEGWVSAPTSGNVEIIGVNCGETPESFPAIVRRMRVVTSLPLLVQPSLGLPQVDSRGRPFYTKTPEAFAEALKPLRDVEGVIIGGCCGTTPEHIARLKQELF